MTIIATLEKPADRRRIQFLEDYCGACNPLGHSAGSRTRLSSLTEPDTVTWRGGKRVICEYVCAQCGHQWRRDDLWSAEQAGFDPKQRSAA